MKSVKCFVENVPKTTHITTQSESNRVASVEAAAQAGSLAGRRANVNKNCAPKNDAQSIKRRQMPTNAMLAQRERRGVGGGGQKIGKLPWQIHIASPFCLLLLHCEIFAMQIGPENCSTLERCSSAIKCKIFNNAAVHKNDRIRKRDRQEERERENGTRN